MIELPAHLNVLITEQQGLITRPQLYAAGVTAGQIRWAVQRDWQLVHRDVFCVTTGRLDPGQRLAAACLFAGEDAQLTGTSAARYFGLTCVPDDGVSRFLVPWARDSRECPGVSVRRTRRPDAHPWHRGLLTLTSPSRAVVDTARLLRGDQVRELLFEAVQRRIVTLPRLVQEVEAGAIRGSAGVRRGLDEVAGGGWSIPESDFADLLATSRTLPTPLFNAELFAGDGTRLPSPDALLADVGLALQVHSRRHHLFEADWERTLHSDTLLGSAGVPVMAFSPHTIRTEGARVLQSVERAYSRLLALGNHPDFRVVPRRAA